MAKWSINAMENKAGTPSFPLTIDCLMEAGSWPSDEELEAMAETVFSAAMSHEEFDREEIAFMPGTEVSLVFTDDDHIARLNLDHRHQNKPTNVLSFPQCPPDSTLFGPFLGDIVFAAETIKREAELDQKSWDGHLKHLMLHGFLHLLGFDHEDDNEAETMEGLETSILATLGIEDPYRDLTENEY